MVDDLIDDTEFEFGMPTRFEMLKHRCALLCEALETTRQDLRKAHKKIMPQYLRTSILHILLLSPN
ncbi:hypothetical protein DM828_11435 [Pseudomonas umsongensis]|nr:hypothetical protein [Pseudomonas umsongensis]